MTFDPFRLSFRALNISTIHDIVFPDHMEPTSILTIVFTSLSVIAKTSICLKELSQKYRNISQDITLIIVRLHTMEAIMSQISCWLKSGLSVEGEAQMMSDINTAVAACEFVVGEIYNHVNRVRDGWLGGKIKHMWTEDQLHQHQRSLDSQISALGVLLNIAILRNQTRQHGERGKAISEVPYERGLEYYFDESSSNIFEPKNGAQRTQGDLAHAVESPPSDFQQELLLSRIYKTRSENKEEYHEISTAHPTSTIPIRRAEELERFHTPSSDTATGNISSGNSSHSSTRSIRSEKIFLNTKSRRQQEEKLKLSEDLRTAVLQGQPSLAQSLCSNGADANYRYRNHSNTCDVRPAFGRLFHKSYGYGEPTLLHHAAENGNQEIARILLDHGADPNARDKNGKSPLHLATDDLAEILLHHGADPSLKDNKGATPLHYMAFSGNSNAVAACIQAGSYINTYDKMQQTPLHFACIGGHRKVVSLLVKTGAYINMAVVDRLTPLHFAAKHGHDRIVRGLLRAGADFEATSKRGWRPIHYAACNGSTKVIESLLAAQVDVNAKVSGGQTTLHLAITNGKRDAVHLVLGGGADIERRDDKGNTPLFLAVTSMRPDILSTLLQHGVQVNAAKSNGNTAILEACSSQAPAQTTLHLVRLLLENGSRVNPKNAAGHTPLQAACPRAEGGLLMAQTLLSHGARVLYEDYVCLWRNRNIPAWERGAIKAELDVIAPHELKKDEVEWVMIAL